MTYFYTIVMFISVALLAVCAWGLKCNKVTAKQRKKILHVLFSSPNWRSLRDEYESVSYEDHLFALMTFRDPLSLYGPGIRRALQ